MAKTRLTKFFRRFLRTLLTGLLLFIISFVIMFLARHFFRIVGFADFVNESNRHILWAINLPIVFFIEGNIVNFIMRHIFTKKSEKLIDAMKKIADGEFSVRLGSTGKLMEISLPTATSFNDMVSQLQSDKELNKDFAGNFSHELKTPLGTINGFAKILKNPEISEEDRQEYLDVIINETERLSHLSNNILLLSRLEKQTAEISKIEYNLTEQLRHIIIVFNNNINEKDLAITLEAEEQTIFANRELLSQLWINLLDNAIKYSPEGESIYVDVKNYADRVSVSIKNYGCVLGEKDIPYIFDKFYRETDKKITFGNGLGLAIVKKIAELHNGFVTAILTEGGSITFTVTLPLLQ